MYKFNTIGFRPIEESDLELLRANRNDSETLLFLGSVNLISSEQQKEWYRTVSKSTKEQWFSVVDINLSKVVGVLRFQNIDHINSCCEIGADVFNEFRGKGYGKLIYKMALEYLFHHFNMNIVYLRVAEYNNNAINLYKKIGFIESGVIPFSIYRFGKYWNNIIMFISKDIYKQLREKNEL
jgi:RimJ/RimL family protein N-acetyltransferase